MWYIIGGVFVALTIVLILVALMATSPVGQFILLMMALAGVCAAVVVFGLGSHRSWWTTGGARRLALVGVSAFLAALGLSVFQIAAQTWFRMNGLGIVADSFGPMTIALFLIAGAGMLYTAMGNKGSPAWLVGFLVLTGLLSGTNIARIYSYGERADYTNPLTGNINWSACSLQYGDATNGVTIKYPVWDNQKNCPLQPGTPTAIKSVEDPIMKEWLSAGLAPGMDDQSILDRSVCRLQKEQGVATALTLPTGATQIDKIRALRDAEGENQCNVRGDLKSTVSGINWTTAKAWAFPGIIVILLVLAGISAVIGRVMNVANAAGSSDSGPAKPH